MMIHNGFKKAVLASTISATLLFMAGCSNNDDDTPSAAEVQASLYQSMDQYQSQKETIDPFGFAISDSAMKSKADLVQQMLVRIASFDRSVLSEQDQIFMDMFQFDLETEMMGYQVGGLDRNVISQIPITHFRNYVEDKISYVFSTHNPVTAFLDTGLPAYKYTATEQRRINDYFTGFTNQEGDSDLEHLRSHAPSVPQLHQQITKYRSLSDPLDFYRGMYDYNTAYLGYVQEVIHQFKQGVEDGNTLPRLLVDKLVAQFQPHIASNGQSLNEIAAVTAALDAIPANNEDDVQFKDNYLQLMTNISTQVAELNRYLSTEYAAREFNDPVGGAVDASIPHGWGGMQDGEDWYNWLLRTHTTTDRTANQIYQTGLDEVDRVFGEMVEVCYNVGQCSTNSAEQARNTGQIYQFFDELKQEKYFYLNPHSNGDGVVEGDEHDSNWWAMWDYSFNPNTLDDTYYPQLDTYPADDFNTVRGELSDDQLEAYKEHRRSLKEYYTFKKNVEDNQVLEQWFAEKTIPELDYAIVPNSFADAPYVGVASYNTYGSPVNGIGGQFNLNTYYPYALQSWNISTLLSHEAAPGHHFQLIIANQLAAEHPEWPDLIKGSHNTAYVEGWALYTEDLAKTHLGVYKGKGLYNPNLGDITDAGDDDNPPSEAYLNELQKFGQLNEEMLRSMRLVVDTGLHAKGWTHNKAAAYMKENSALGDGDVSSEVPRYMAYTGQAVSYKTGSLTLLDLRKELADHLGVEVADIPVEHMKEFHHQVLELGALPLGVLQTKIRAWIQTV